MAKRWCAAVFCTTAIVWLAAPAAAQYTVRRPPDPATGEKYVVELQANWWKPSSEISISSESLGIPRYGHRSDQGSRDGGRGFRRTAGPPAVRAQAQAALRIAPDEYFFLQPTRVVRRKGIEHAIELIKRLDVGGKLVISHASGDEGDEYAEHVRTFAKLFGVDVIFSSDIIGDTRGTAPDGRKIYSLDDIYPFCDLVTYPSLMEGFGNAFLEAIYFRNPLVVNNYTIYSTDIHPKGFRAIEFDGFITPDTVAQVHQVLSSQDLAQEMAEHNYNLARKYYSFGALQHHLEALLFSCFGEGYQGTQ